MTVSFGWRVLTSSPIGTLTNDIQRNQIPKWNDLACQRQGNMYINKMRVNEDIKRLAGALSRFWLNEVVTYAMTLAESENVFEAVLPTEGVHGHRT